jgi:hypothetical protein
MGARLSQECVTIMADSMVSALFHNQFRVNTYQDWVDQEADFGPVYAFHEQQLQHLQWRVKRDRWVLKTGPTCGASSICSPAIPMRGSS